MGRASGGRSRPSSPEAGRSRNRHLFTERPGAAVVALAWVQFDVRQRESSDLVFVPSERLRPCRVFYGSYTL